MKNRLGIVVAACLCLLGLGIATRGRQAPTVVHAQTQPKSCDATSLNGAYGYSLTGSTYDSQFNLYLFAAAGRMVADGAGNITGADSYNFDGTPGKRTYTGTYTVNADCTGSLTFKTANNNTSNLDFTAVNNAKEVNFVQTDPSWIVSGLAKLQTQ